MLQTIVLGSLMCVIIVGGGLLLIHYLVSDNTEIYKEILKEANEETKKILDSLK